MDIIEKCEGVVLRGDLFHCIYLTNNEFGIELLLPNEGWLEQQSASQYSLLFLFKNIGSFYRLRFSHLLALEGKWRLLCQDLFSY